jgi:sodium/hydrogen exchanger-like protein 6/7
MVVGLIIRLSPGTSIQSFVTFDYQFFFNLLLPPIILASGYELHQVSLERAGKLPTNPILHWAGQWVR